MERSNMTTLCYIESDDSFLMMHRVKKKQDVNQDKWIGVGGHFEYGESPEECLLRETKEETGLTLTSYRFRGLVTFIADQYQPEYMCLYTSDGFEGTVGTCREGDLEWIRKDKVLELNLWEGDKIFFQLLNENAPFFSLKLRYESDRLMEACLNGEELELLDILDKTGQRTGKTQARHLIHAYGIPHATTHVWIVRPNKKSGYDLLLQRRSAGKDAYPGCYDISSAGHVPAGCDYLESALRELDEELGVTALPEELREIGSHEEKETAMFYGRPFHNHEISRVYLYDRPLLEEQLRLQASEVESVMWLDFEECRKQVGDHTLTHCISEDELIMVGMALGMKTCGITQRRNQDA